jgi:hypothetical protein
MEQKNEELTLDNLNGGAVADLFDEELEIVKADIGDINKVADGERSITIKISFKPTKDRSSVAVNVLTDSKLAKREPNSGSISLMLDKGKVKAYPVKDLRQQPLPLEFPNNNEKKA